MNGQYQNYIQDLPGLQTFRYENIFKVYQTEDKNFYFYNIIKNIKMPDNINDTVFDLITLKSNQPLTTLSYEIYGTTYLWWLICIMNNIQNPFDVNNIGKQIKVLKKQYLKIVLNTINQQLK